MRLGPLGERSDGIGKFCLSRGGVGFHHNLNGVAPSASGVRKGSLYPKGIKRSGSMLTKGKTGKMVGEK